MKTRTTEMRKSTLLVLVPHRDARQVLRAWSGELFAAGFPGAWSFPHVAPLATVARPLSRDTLKTIACALRECCISSTGSTGKITGGLPQFTPFPDKHPQAVCPVALFGPVLNIELPPAFFSAAGDEAAVSPFSPIVLGAALADPSQPWSFALQNSGTNSRRLFVPPPPQVSFRAAGLANMTCRPLPDNAFSLEWKIGELVWLPPVYNKT